MVAVAARKYMYSMLLLLYVNTARYSANSMVKLHSKDCCCVITIREA